MLHWKATAPDKSEEICLEIKSQVLYILVWIKIQVRPIHCTPSPPWADAANIHAEENKWYLQAV